MVKPSHHQHFLIDASHMSKISACLERKEDMSASMTLPLFNDSVEQKHSPKHPIAHLKMSSGAKYLKADNLFPQKAYVYQKTYIYSSFIKNINVKNCILAGKVATKGFPFHLPLSEQNITSI